MEGIIADMYERCIRAGVHPKRWRRAIAAIIPKPGKADYCTVKSYRPILLLSILGKGLEKIVANAIYERAEENKEEGFHKLQWGGRRKRSAEEAVEHTLNWAREREEEGLKVILVMTDVAQAFPNVAKVRLANRIRAMGMGEEIAEWVESFMTDREVKLRIDGEEAEWQKIDTGIPQGSPISPILFNIYIAPLLRELERECEARWKGKVITPTFIDDVTLVVSRESWEEAIVRAEEIMEIA